VERVENLLILDAVGQRYGVRPSAILGIEDAWLAWQLDVAVLAAVGSRQGGGRRHSGARADKASGFAGLGTRARAVKLPESGVW